MILSTMNLSRNIPFCFLLIACISLSVACNSKHDNTEIQDSATYVGLRSGYLEKLVRDIAQYSTVDAAAAAVGFGGVQSGQYELFLMLRKIATNEELIQLTTSSNANVKAYAFKALADRDYPNCRLLLQQHLNDTTSFQYLSGCIGSTLSVNAFYLSCLSGKLSKAEIASYETQISNRSDGVATMLH